jgi:hypothetical protein
MALYRRRKILRTTSICPHIVGDAAICGPAVKSESILPVEGTRGHPF